MIFFYILCLCLNLAAAADFPLPDCHTRDMDLLLVAGEDTPDTINLKRMKNLAGYFLDNKKSNNVNFRVSLQNFYKLKFLNFSSYQSREEMEKDFDRFSHTFDGHSEMLNDEKIIKFYLELNDTIWKLRASNKQHIIVWIFICKDLCDINMSIVSYFCSFLNKGFNFIVLISADITKNLTIYKNCLIQATAIRADDELENTNVLGLKLCGQCSNGWWTYQSQQRPYVSSCYKVEPASQLLTKSMAQNNCQEMKAALVNIETYEELQWLSLMLKSQDTTVQYFTIFTGLYLKKYQMVQKYEWSNERPFLIISALTNSTLSSYSGMCWVLKFVNDASSRDMSNYILKIIEPVVCDVPVANFIVCELDLLGHTPTQGDPNALPFEYIEKIQLKDNPVNIDKDYLFNCSSHKQYLVYSFVCDGYNDCRSGLDEKYCLGMDILKRSMNDYFLCPYHSKRLDAVITGQLSSGKICDGVQDCLDNADEMNCGDECKEKLCSDGTCIPSHWLKIVDNDCKKYFSVQIIDKDYFVNQNVLNETKLLPYEISWCNESDTFSFENDENSSHVTTKNTWSPTCVYIKGRSLSILGCSDLSHLKNCENFSCPPKLAKCPYSYCIPTHYMFDGVQDCMYGEDEEMVLSVTDKDLQDCLHIMPRMEGVRICDGKAHCFNYADEASCHGFCPKGFNCQAGVLKVENISTIISPQVFDTIDKDTSVLVLSGLDLSFLNDINVLSHPLEYHFSHCNISKDAITFGIEDRLYKVDMSYNNLKQLTNTGIFAQNKNLQYVFLHHNEKLYRIDENAFLSDKMRVLDLSFTMISSIPSKVLQSKFLEQLILQSTKLLSLEFFPSSMVVAVLDLRNITTIQLETMDLNAFKGLQVTEAMHTDDYRLCCPQLTGTKIPQHICLAPVDAISSCNDLLADTTKRVLVWLVASIASVGNVIVLMYRLIFDRHVLANAFGVFVVCLGISDFLMGVYLFIIAAVDVHYRDMYVLHEMEWRGSTWCRVAGFLSTFSGETSAFFVLLITVDRYLAMAYPFGQLRFKSWSLYLTVVLAWILGVILAVMPVTVPNWTIYSSNGMCLGIPLTNKEIAGWQYAVTVFIALNFILFCMIAFGQMSIFKAMSQNRVIQESKVNASHREKDVEVAKQLFLVAMSNFICWFPISITGVISKCGVVLSPEVYAWLVVFILPLNAAVNPLIYTIPFIYRKWLALKKGYKR